MNLKTKLILIFSSLAILIGLGFAISMQHKHIKELQTELAVAVNNNKAYEAENSALDKKIIQFELAVSELNASKDSVIQKLASAKRQLKIKDKQIKELQYIASENRKKDSIIVHDTIFHQGVAIDTTIGDK